MAAEFWTSERSRASWSWTISVLPALGQVAHGQQDGAVHEPGHRGSDQLSQPPPGGSAEPDLDGGAHTLLLHAGQGEENHLHVVRMDEVEAVHPGGLDDGPAEGGLCGAVGPLENAALVDDDDRVGELVEQTDQGALVHGRRGGLEVLQPDRRHTTIIDPWVAAL